jgi:hypothetical protein
MSPACRAEPATAGLTAAFPATGASHVAIYNRTFLLGPSLMPGIDALLLGSMMYRSRLVPRVIPMLGIIGAPAHQGRDRDAVRRIGQYSSAAVLAALPVADWEFSFGVWLGVKGFRPSPITAGTAADRPLACHDVVV